MTTGQLIFYGGIGLLIITIILGIIFWIKKPQYIPENAAYDATGNRRTQKLRSGYPTDRLTIRREPDRPVIPGTILLQEETAWLTAEQADLIPGTEVLSGADALNHQSTEKLDAGTAPLPEGTVPLGQDEETSPLCGSVTAVDGETALLDPSGQSGDTEKISGTTPLSGI